MIIGITGGSGCGKTSLLELIRERGGLVFDCDAVYHRLLETDAALNASLQNRFPEAYENGRLQRKKLGSIVFRDPRALKDLNAITHGAVKAEILKELARTAPALAAIDAIALFESGLDSLCDCTAAVAAPREDRIARLMIRDGIDAEYAASRIDAQHDDSWFRDRCSVFLYNSGSLDDFRKKCSSWLDGLLTG